MNATNDDLEWAKAKLRRVLRNCCRALRQEYRRRLAELRGSR